MSKLVKSSQLTIDNKKYILSTDFFVASNKVHHPIDDDVQGESEESHEVRKRKLEDELQKMKEDMLEVIKVESDKKSSTAKEEFDSIIKEAYDQADAVKEASKNEGYEIGFNEGLNNGYSEVESTINEVLEMKNKYYQKYEQIKNDSQKEITEIILSTVEKILNKRIEEDYELVKGLVEKALVKCAFTANLVLRVAADDYDGAISLKRYILSLTEGVEDIEIRQDAALAPGSCIIDTDAGSVDSSIWTQFEIVKSKFEELLRNE